MCGIAGMLFVHAERCADIRLMLQAIHHRGPDARGIWHNKEHGCVLGHNRLSILDLSTSANQPMHSACGRYVLIYNGEIYNQNELKSLVAEYSFRSHSDTEILLALIVKYGAEQALQKSQGMFAFALWDEKDKSLILARDRFGEKPLFYGWQNGQLIFCSELSGFAALPWYGKKIKKEAVASYMRYGYVSGTHSIYESIHKLPPGCYLKIDSKGHSQKNEYWSSRQRAIQAKASPFNGDFSEAIDVLDNKLTGVVKRQLLADVPVGTFLSGGIDSSLITAIAQQQSSSSIKTFSIGFKEKAYDESVYAKKIAEKLGTQHHEYIISEDDCVSLVEKMPLVYSEPFADASQIPTYFLCHYAKKRVTVALSGDAGDEIFGGYSRHFLIDRFSQLSDMPWWKKYLIKKLVKVAIREKINPVRYVNQCLPVKYRKNINRESIQKVLTLMDCAGSTEKIYESLLKQSEDCALRGSHETCSHYHAVPGWDDASILMLADTQGYLPSDILTKVDIAAMSASLETRIPFLDQSIFDFAWSLPTEFKIQNNGGKRILKALLSKYVDKQYFERSKMGFGVPVSKWLSGVLKESLFDSIQRENTVLFDFIDRNKLQKFAQDHIAGISDHSMLLWRWLMLSSWYEGLNHAKMHSAQKGRLVSQV